MGQVYYGRDNVFVAFDYFWLDVEPYDFGYDCRLIVGFRYEDFAV